MSLRLSSKPLRDTKADAALFVDREHEIERIRRALRADLNVLLLGERGSGRTSLLKHLAYRCRTEWNEAHVFVEGGLAADARTFLSLLRFRLLGDQQISAGEALARGARSAAGLLSGEPSLSIAAPRHETEELLALYADVAAAAARKPGCIVLVDEVASADLTHTIFGRFRDETWELPLRWIVAGDVDARATYLKPPADAFFEVVVELDSLSETAALEIVRRRLGDETLSATDLRALVAMSDGIPRRLLASARRLVVDGAELDELETVRAWQSARLAELGPSARRLFEDLETFGPASASDPELLARLDWTRGRAAQVFRQLERSQLVRGSSRRSTTGGPDRRVFEPVATAQ
jgi:hypothetical protein